jgi:hypothetical protein
MNLFDKLLFSFLFALSCSSVLAQQNGNNTKGKVLLPQLDSMVIDLNRLFINPENILNMWVLKDPDSLTRKKFKGAIGSIAFKKLPQLTPINQLKLDRFNSSQLAPIYFIDGIMLTDTAGVKIDLLNVKELEAINSEKNTTFNKWSIVYIVTTGNKGARAASNRKKRILKTKFPL